MFKAVLQIVVGLKYFPWASLTLLDGSEGRHLEQVVGLTHLEPRIAVLAIRIHRIDLQNGIWSNRWFAMPALMWRCLLAHWKVAGGAEMTCLNKPVTPAMRVAVAGGFACEVSAWMPWCHHNNRSPCLCPWTPRYWKNWCWKRPASCIDDHGYWIFATRASNNWWTIR